ncbi:hypothetical protein A2U01_0028854, partial [Trifolium medium]|nr:hypothetical protein [Trifolium medium]
MPKSEEIDKTFDKDLPKCKIKNLADVFKETFHQIDDKDEE